VVLERKGGDPAQLQAAVDRVHEAAGRVANVELSDEAAAAA